MKQIKNHPSIIGFGDSEESDEVSHIEARRQGSVMSLLKSELQISDLGHSLMISVVM